MLRGRAWITRQNTRSAKTASEGLVLGTSASVAKTRLALASRTGCRCCSGRSLGDCFALRSAGLR
eukprot:3922211-Alexandrium_andersonii.AAC.1